ncbi:MAG TPA: DNA methyltransferase, partial [Ferruginibacter sp.]|nr:DNA methyltransferase [Ferruginibacter sp.]
MIKERLFGDFDFSGIYANPDFKEDSVREVIILPILKELGYIQPNIVRSKILQHPFLKTGSTKRPVNLVPDYSLKVEENFAWVLDAKAPNEKISNSDNVEQVFSYAIHPEIRSVYFALCNGNEFALYRTQSSNIPVLLFNINEIEHYWKQLSQLLSPNSFQAGKNFTYETTIATAKPIGFDYKTRPLLEEIDVKKRSAKRHFGVHGYFTKQSWNVVSEYIKNFSKPGDLILDPFGGSGVTAIEALMLNRKAINIDLNPLAVFIVQSLIAPVNLDKLSEAFRRIKEEYIKKEPKTENEIALALEKYPHPTGHILPRGSDVTTVEGLFSKKQLSQLGLLKVLIKTEKDSNIKDSLMLMFSGLLTKVNLTYHTGNTATKDGQGNASAFQYYRYRIAPSPKDVDMMKYFELRFKKICEAKKEMSFYINHNTIENAQIIKGTATDLKWIP